jgi:hypothetical protein
MLCVTLPAPLFLICLGVYSLGPDDGRLFWLGAAIVIVALAVLAYVVSRLRNYVIFHSDHLDASMWLLFVGSKHSISYDHVFEVAADDIEGRVKIWFDTGTGERDSIELQMSSNSDASAVRDAITLRQPQSRRGDALEPERVFDEEELKALIPSGTHDDRQIPTEVYQFITRGWFVVVAVLSGLAAAFTDGPLVDRFLGWMGFTAMLWLILVVMRFASGKSRFVLRADRAEFRSNDEQHKIPYHSITEVTGSDTGDLNIHYQGKALLGLREGAKELSVRIKPHSDAPRIAAAIRLARDRALEASLQPQLPT